MAILSISHNPATGLEAPGGLTLKTALELQRPACSLAPSPPQIILAQAVDPSTQSAQRLGWAHECKTGPIDINPPGMGPWPFRRNSQPLCWNPGVMTESHARYLSPTWPSPEGPAKRSRIMFARLRRVLSCQLRVQVISMDALAAEVNAKARAGHASKRASAYPNLLGKNPWDIRHSISSESSGR